MANAFVHTKLHTHIFIGDWHMAQNLFQDGGPRHLEFPEIVLSWTAYGGQSYMIFIANFILFQQCKNFDDRLSFGYSKLKRCMLLRQSVYIYSVKISTLDHC